MNILSKTLEFGRCGEFFPEDREVLIEGDTFEMNKNQILVPNDLFEILLKKVKGEGLKNYPEIVKEVLPELNGEVSVLVDFILKHENSVNTAEKYIKNRAFVDQMAAGGIDYRGGVTVKDKLKTVLNKNARPGIIEKDFLAKLVSGFLKEIGIEGKKAKEAKKQLKKVLLGGEMNVEKFSEILGWEPGVILELQQELSGEGGVAEYHELSEEKLENAFCEEFNEKGERVRKTLPLEAEFEARNIETFRSEMFSEVLTRGEEMALAQHLAGEFDDEVSVASPYETRKAAKKMLKNGNKFSRILEKLKLKKKNGKSQLDEIRERFSILKNSEGAGVSGGVKGLLKETQYFAEKGGPDRNGTDDEKFQAIGERIKELLENKEIKEEELMYIHHSFGPVFARSIITRSFFRDGGLGSWNRMHELNVLDIDKVDNDFDHYYLRRASAVAVRERTTVMADSAVAYLLEKETDGEALVMCDVPCGSGEVSLRVLMKMVDEGAFKGENAVKLEMYLQDMEPKAVTFSQERLNAFIKENKLEAFVTLKPQVTMAGVETKETYDILLCPGLLDYFPEKKNKNTPGFVDTKMQLIRKMLKSVKDGGMAYIGNYLQDHPTRNDMRFLASWDLELDGVKTKDDLVRISQSAGKRNAVIAMDLPDTSKNTQAMVEITKPTA